MTEEELARVARELLAIHARMTPDAWERLRPWERRFIADVFTRDHLEILRRMAEKGLR